MEDFSKDKAKFFKDFVSQEILEKESIVSQESLINMSEEISPEIIRWENNKPSLQLWLKSRLFEPVVASIGVEKYIEDLLRYKGDKPEKEVQINSFLASTNISSSLNLFIVELLRKLNNKNKLSLNESHFQALSDIYKPRKDFKATFNDTKFFVDEIENIRDILLRTSLDLLTGYNSMEEGYYLRPEHRVEDNKIPDNLIKIGSISDFTIRQLTTISQTYTSSLKIWIMEGYVVWKFRDQPTIFLKSGQAYYSPNRSKYLKTNDKEMAKRQLFLIEEKLEIARKSPTVPCAICGERYTSNIMYHSSKGIAPICENCSKDEKVKGHVATLRNKEEPTS